MIISRTSLLVFVLLVVTPCGLTDRRHRFVGYTPFLFTAEQTCLQMKRGGIYVIFKTLFLGISQS